MSILDQTASISSRTTCACGGTILTGAAGSEQEHTYCDSCDRVEHRADVDTWITWRTDAAHGGLWADSVEAALAQLITQREWAALDSERETADIADGAWLTISQDGLPVLTRGQMP